MAVSNPLVRVGQVPFGRGVFARQAIPAGATIGQVSGRVIYDPNYASNYCIDLGHPVSMEPFAPFRFLNHCCTPNSQFVTVDVQYEDGTPAPCEVYVEALTDIEPGQELTIDYSWSADAAIKCLCGSAQCRGWVVSADELADLLARKQREAAKRREAKARREAAAQAAQRAATSSPAKSTAASKRPARPPRPRSAARRTSPPRH